MIRSLLLAVVCTAGFAATAAAQTPYYTYARTYSTHDWQRLNHYPYVYYPHNFWSADYFRSSGSLYWRYPPEMQIPVYNKQWHNYYPERRRYHYGAHFILDVF